MLKHPGAACAVVIIVLICAAPAGAQDSSSAAASDGTAADTPSKAADQDQSADQNTESSPFADKIRHYIDDNPIAERFQKDGFYPRIGGLNAGGGLAGGVGYHRHLNGMDNGIYTDVSGAVSMKRYLGLDLRARWLQTRQKTFEIWTEYAFRDDTKDPYYGRGLQSPPAAVTDYAVQSHDLLARAIFRPWQAFHVGAALGVFSPDLRRGHDTIIPSIEREFTDATAPGLSRQPTFVHDSVFVEVDRRDVSGTPRRGGLYRATFSVWDDRTFNQFDFNRLDVDGSHFIAVSPADVLALRLTLNYAHSASGNRIPFYLMPSLGGGDTLRSYREFRFRDYNAGIFSVELRHQLFPLVHVAGFIDAGKVADDWRGINPANLKTSFGIGIRAATPNVIFLRLDAAFGGQEGPRIFLKFTPGF